MARRRKMKDALKMQEEYCQRTINTDGKRCGRKLTNHHRSAGDHDKVRTLLGKEIRITHTGPWVKGCPIHGMYIFDDKVGELEEKDDTSN